MYDKLSKKPNLKKGLSTEYTISGMYKSNYTVYLVFLQKKSILTKKSNPRQAQVKAFFIVSDDGSGNLIIFSLSKLSNFIICKSLPFRMACA
ncbi:hypothetical protein Ga0466249_001308 [Sporomusaceae bacterium BoRhaA]|nr:hypothetical protein [Pelorhabdus rhamnosifermentans]